MTTSSELLRYDLGPGVEAFSTRRDSELPYPVVQSHQVHGVRVAVVDRPDLTREELEGVDALVTALPGCALKGNTTGTKRESTTSTMTGSGNSAK